jgi:hypothetical protein
MLQPPGNPDGLPDIWGYAARQIARALAMIALICQALMPDA